MVVVIVIAVLLGAVAMGLIYLRSRGARTAKTLLPARGIAAAIKSRGAAPNAVPDAARAALANDLVTERLWKLAFAAAAETAPLEAAHERVGDAVSAGAEGRHAGPEVFSAAADLDAAIAARGG